MRSRALALCSSVAVVAALVSCKPKLGRTCDKGDTHVVCSGPKSALVCAGGHWVDKPCAEWCMKKPDPLGGEDVTECTDDVRSPAIGDPCFLPATLKMPTEESACAPDGTAILSCRADQGQAGGGFWTVLRTCAPGKKCMPLGGATCMAP